MPSIGKPLGMVSSGQYGGVLAYLVWTRIQQDGQEYKKTFWDEEIKHPDSNTVKITYK